MKDGKIVEVDSRKHAEEAKRWRRVNADPEAWLTDGGYGLGRIGMQWSLVFVGSSSTMMVLAKVESPEESPPFCWAREMVDKIQVKRTCVGWLEKRVKGKPGDEDISVSKDLIRKVAGVGVNE